MTGISTQPQSAAECPCDGSGTYTFSISVANAVVSTTRQCPVHGQSPRHDRPLALDTATNRIGEVMETADTPGSRNLYWLRPIGGGREWDVEPQNVQLLDNDALASS